MGFSSLTSREFEAVTELPGQSKQVALIRKGPRLPIQVAKPQTSNAAECVAMIDTGAGHSAIAMEVVKHLGLRKVGEIDVQTQGGPQTLPVYRVDLYIEDLSRVQIFSALGSPWIAKLGLGALLGRDALRNGSFTYDGLRGRYALRFYHQG